MKPIAHQLFYTYRRHPTDPLPGGWAEEVYGAVDSPSWVFSVLDDRMFYHLIVPQSAEEDLPEKGLLAPGVRGVIHTLTETGWQYSDQAEAASRARSAIALTLGKHPLFQLDGGKG